MTYYIEYIYICLFAICISSAVMCLYFLTVYSNNISEKKFRKDVSAWNYCKAPLLAFIWDQFSPKLKFHPHFIELKTKWTQVLDSSPVT